MTSCKIEVMAKDCDRCGAGVVLVHFKLRGVYTVKRVRREMMEKVVTDNWLKNYIRLEDLGLSEGDL
jgi:ribosomal protein S27AE